MSCLLVGWFSHCVQATASEQGKSGSQLSLHIALTGLLAEIMLYEQFL